jgi:starch-binding outer membrane protein SusE/F
MINMHTIFKSLIASFLVAAVISSCKKEETKIYFEGGTAPVLSGSTTAVRLEAGEEANVAIKISWSNPDYKFTTGGSSHDVNYLLEIDTANTATPFTSSRKQSISVSRELSYTFTVGALNAILGNTMLLQLNPRRTYNMQARLTSSIANGVGKLVSNTIAFTVIPFPPPPKVPLPAAGNLWITGDAVASNWANPHNATDVVTHKFTRLPSFTDYELFIDMKATGAYKLIQIQGDWSTQYHMVTGGTGLGGSFEFGDANPSFPSPGVAGRYRLLFNFQLGTWSAVKQ